MVRILTANVGPPPDSMASARLKVQEAHAQLVALGAELAFWGKTLRPNTIIGEVDPKTSDKIYRYRILTNPPPQWGITVGHVANGLRSALNHAVHAVANPDSKGVGFPIFRVEKDYINPSGKKRISPRDQYLEGVAEDPFRAIIDSYQPYKRGNLANSDKLAALADLSNTDKHSGGLLKTTLIPVEITLSFSAVGPHESFKPRILIDENSVLYDGAVVARIAVRPPETKVAMHGKISLSIAFGDRNFPGIELDGLERHVVEIIDRLDSARTKSPGP